MTQFLGVVPTLADALTERGYTKLTPVQEAVLDPDFIAADLLVSAQTGSGKTVAFGLNMAPSLLDEDGQMPRSDKPLALIIAPTRELALQVKKELQWLYRPAGAFFASCVGGMNMSEERKALKRGAHIVVGTPGRLRDHVDRGSLDLSNLQVAVLDEADEMLNMGFSDDMEYILGAAPTERRTLMFSATVPRGIERLAKKYQRNAIRVNTKAEASQHLDIEYRALTVGPKDSENAIINVLQYFDAKNAIVFCATRAAVNRMVSRFNNRGFKVVALSGELSQSERTHALQAMRSGRARVCIATDVAARGLDLPDLELVIHADIPKNKEILLHRSGRTGRAGRKGTCAIIVPHPARKRTERLLRDANIEAEWANPPSAENVMRKEDERLMNDPNLSKKSTDKEYAMADALIDRYGAQQMAAAYIHLYRANKSSPEELTSTKSYDPSAHEDRPRRSKGKGRDFGKKRPHRGQDGSRRKPKARYESTVDAGDYADVPPQNTDASDRPNNTKKKKPHKKKLARAAAREAAKAKGSKPPRGKSKGGPSGAKLKRKKRNK
ncbi:MAG: DEAD/DEAH box helicase [Acidimicrobiales bacterium]|nr:DEAD/DEAH box helicase [Hyphomonadaceae bacterium]RZV44601.1 MAG: DEAD/DEAH box helicase [Acidimicrobiales bacterium]